MRKVIYLLLLALAIASCDKKQNKVHQVTDFSKPISDSLVPEQGETYTTKYIRIEGKCDDSIRITAGEGSNSFYFKGNVNETLKFDYYGVGNAHFEFDPYKARSGNLKVEFAIL